MLLYGKNSVFERLKANPASIRKILLEDRFHYPPIEKLIQQKNIPVERLSSQQLLRIKHTDNLQGIIAKVDSFRYTPFDDLLSQPFERKLTLVFLDRVYDPQNLGAIIRTTACFGGFALIIPKFKACGVNETVLHVAQGGENYVPIACVTNMAYAVRAAKNEGYWIMGAIVAAEASDINHTAIPFPAGLVLGSEGSGLRYGINKLIDVRVRIPMQGASLSFNVAIACAIFCYEITKQRK